MDSETTTMLAAAKRIPSKQGLLTSLLIGDKIVPVETSKVDIDHYMGTRKLAPVVHRRIGHKVVGPTAWSNYELTTPLVAPRWVLDEDFMQQRMPGEPVVNGMSIQDREDAWVGTRIADGRAMVDRRIEWMCAQQLSTGILTIEGDGYEDVIDFNHSNSETLGAAAQWDEATGDPIADLEGWIQECQYESGVTPNVCVMGTTAAGAFLRNATVQQLLDVRNYAMGRIEPRSMPQGGRYLGYLSALDLEVYSYGAQYEADDGTMTPYLAADRVVLFPAAERNSAVLVYAAIRDAEKKEWYQVDIYPRRFADTNANQEYLEVLSKPLLVYPEADSWYWADVV